MVKGLRTSNRTRLFRIVSIFGILVIFLQSISRFWLRQRTIPTGISFPPVNQAYGNSVFSLDNFSERIKPLDFTNATAVFNEVNNAMKRENADLNPIGVSYFPAYIPVGTHLYHSTHSGGQIPDSFEWVAMDYEFSYSFAHFYRNNNPNGGHRDHGPPHRGDGHGPPPDGHPDGHPHGSPWGRDSHLLTFEVRRPLDKLIYLGGASAAKRDTGVMDTQYILSRAESYDQFDERSAAKRICDWGKKNGGLDGYVRLEIGFELVICDFHDKLGLVSNVSLSNLTETLHFLPERPDDGSDPLNLQRSLVIDNLDAMAGFEWLESGARVYGGDSRILLDFSKFVTPIGQTYIDPDPYKRRIYNVSTQLKEKMIDGVANILSTPNDPYQKTDWRQITEGIEKKFGPILMGLNNSFTMYDSHKDSGILGQNLTTYTFNFVRRYLVEPDYNLTPSSKKMAVWDYVHPYKPLTTEPELLIFSSITVVQARIVDMMDSVFQLGRSLLSVYGGKGVDSEYAERHTESIREEVKALLDELNWPVIYGCRNACKSDEICLVPTWGPSPMGWGGRGIGFNEGADGITRINRDFTCVSYRKLLE